MPTMTRLLTVALTLALAGCGATPSVTGALPEASALSVEVTALKAKARPGQPTHVTTKYTAVRGESREPHEAGFDYDPAADRIVPGSIVLDKQTLTDVGAIAQATEELEAVLDSPR